jgi:hypothetical protein
MVEPIAGVPQLRLKHSVVNRKLAQIEPSTERVTLTGDHDAPDRIVATKVLKRIDHLESKGNREGILLLFSVQGDCCHAVFAR